MKILVSGVPRSFGGIGTLIDNITECNEEQGRPLTFTFLVPEGSPYLTHFVEKGYEVVPVPPLTHPVAYRRTLQALFTRERFDAVWFNNTSKVDMILPVLAKKSGAKLIAHSHGTKLEETGVKRIAFQMVELLTRSKFFSMIDCPLACNRASADYFYRGYPHPEQVQVIPNGIRLRRFTFRQPERTAVREELGLRPEEMAICSVGRLSAVKNNQLLIRVMAQLPETYRLFLVGKGVEEQALRDLAAECGVAERVMFLGFRADVDRILNGMDVYAMPSLHEGMPFALIEAQANGLPCVVTEHISREVALTELVQFVPIEDETAWTSAIESISLEEDRYRRANEIRQAGYGIEDSFSAFREVCAHLNR